MKRVLGIGLVLAALGIDRARGAGRRQTDRRRRPGPRGSAPKSRPCAPKSIPTALATTYLFEYTTEAEFRTKGFIGATKVPQTGISIGIGLVAQRLDD